MISPSDPRAQSVAGELPCPGNNCGTSIQVKLTWVEGSAEAAAVTGCPARCPERTCREPLSAASWDEGLRAVAWSQAVEELTQREAIFFAALVSEEEVPWRSA